MLIVDSLLDSSPTSPNKCGDIISADYIAITHGHVDHFADAGPLVHKFNSTVICGHWIAENLAKFINIDLETMIKVTARNRFTSDDLKIEVKKADHVAHASRQNRL